MAFCKWESSDDGEGAEVQDEALVRMMEMHGTDSGRTDTVG